MCECQGGLNQDLETLGWKLAFSHGEAMNDSLLQLLRLTIIITRA